MNDATGQTVGSSARHESGGLGRRSLLVNTIHSVGGMGVYHACQLGVLVLLAKFASAEIQGQYLLGLAVAAPILLFFGLELRGALVADAGGQFTIGTYRALRRLMLVPASAVLVGYLIWAARAEGRPLFLLILAGVFLLRGLWSLADVGWGTFQRRERLDLLAAAVGLRGLALLAPFAVLLPFAGEASGEGDHLAGQTAVAILLAAAGSAAILVLFDRPRVADRRHWDLSWNWHDLLRLATQTFPLGLVALAITLCDSFPRLLFESDWVADGTAQLGYFGSLAYITLAGNLVIVQVATAAANRLSQYYQSDIRAFLRLGALLLVAAVGVGAIVMTVALLWGRWILATLYTPAHAGFEAAFHVIVFAHCLALLTNVFGAATTQMRLFWVQVPVQLVTLICTIVAAVMLIPGPTPVLGAAQTALVRALVQLVLYAGCVIIGVTMRRRLLRL